MPVQQGVMRVPSVGKLPFDTPVLLIVIQWALSQPFAGNVIVLRFEPAVTRIVSPQAAALMSACTVEVSESGPRVAPGEGVLLTAVFMQAVGRAAPASVVGPIQSPPVVQ